MPEVEEGSLSEQKCQHENQGACLPSDGDACAPLQSRDMGCDTTGTLESSCIPNEVPVRDCWGNAMGQEEKC